MGHPNGTKAVVTHIGSLRLIDKISINDVLVVSDYHDFVLRTQVRTGSESNGLYFLNTDDPYDDGRDKEFEISKGIDPISSEGTKNTGHTIRDEGEHPDDSAPSEAVSDIEKNATYEVNDNKYEGDDSYYQEFNDMFQPINDIPNR
nr:ribonuclease H-like domain-containing protein [Tanacetum cinerariifolium]